MRVAKVRVPVADERHIYRATNPDSGEILECSDLAVLMRVIALHMDVAENDEWILRREYVGKLP